MKNNTKKLLLFLVIVLLLLFYLSQHKYVETFVLGQLRQRVQTSSPAPDNSGTCYPTNCNKNTSTLTKLTNQCSYIDDQTTCNNAYINKTDGRIPCSWIDGVYDPVHGTCGKNKNSAKGTCGTCF